MNHRMLRNSLKKGMATASLSSLGIDLSAETSEVGAELKKAIQNKFGRSFRIREVDTGSCGACESEIIACSNPLYDIQRFGIDFVASPRHADGLLITGTVTPNMMLALKKTYDAIAYPKIVIAVGACAISGGIYRGIPDENCGADTHVPVDLFIPGCPPNPATILDGLLRLLGRIR